MITPSYLLVSLLLLTSVAGSCLCSAQSAFSSASLQTAAAYAAAHGGSSVMVLEGDEIVFEAYQNGATPATAPHIFSGTKAFWAAAAAAARQGGLISSYNELVSETITEWENVQLHPGKRRIRIEHLLTLTSGLSQDTAYLFGSNPRAQDLYRYAVDSLDLRAAPGSAFSYGPSQYYVIGELLRRKLEASGISQTPLQFLDSLVLQPIGLEYDTWLHDDAGNPHIPNGCHLRPREWIKFGKLLRDYGNWNGSQLVDSALIADLLLPGNINPGHGKFLWLNTQDGYGIVPFQSAPAGSSGGAIYHDGYTGLFSALGAGKNRMYILPSLNAVVVRQTTLSSDNFDDHTFLSALLENVSALTHPEAQDGDQIEVHPNPFTSELRIATPSYPATFELLDANSRIVYQQRLMGPTNVLDIPALVPGPYTAVVQGEAGNTYTQQLILE